MSTIPDPMSNAKRWLLWMSIPNKDPAKKPIKKPYYVSGKPRSGVMDSHEDVAQLATLDDALEAFQKGSYAGLGFALGCDGGTGNYWQGIDLDHLSEHPENEYLKDDLIGMTYCETSPSGDGIHAIGYGRRYESLGSTADGIEAYSEGRFFTVTGDELCIYDPVDLFGFVEKVLRPIRNSKSKNQSIESSSDFASESVSPEQITDLRSALNIFDANNRVDWVDNAHRLYRLGDVGMELWLTWSQLSLEKFDPEDAARVWQSAKPDHTGYKAVFSEAQKLGWINPRSKAAQTDYKGHRSDYMGAGDSQTYDLDSFALNGQSKELEAQLLENKFILGRLAILGQATVIYAPPNTGKTLLMLALLKAGITSGEVAAGDVYFVNADDHYRGAVQKLKIAEEYGFKMLVPSHNGFKSEMLEPILKDLCRRDIARGKVLILDTLKKFTDTMNKSKGTDFMKSVREFVSHGGSVILLGHVNKHRNEEGNVIFAGTSDIVDDCDCAYTLDEVTADKFEGLKTVKFTNFKSRGDNAIEAIYQYANGEGLSYQNKFESVRLLDKNETQATLKRKALADLLERNADAIKVIKQLIRSGTSKKTELIRAAVESGITKTKVQRALTDHEGRNLDDGQLWFVEVQDRNLHTYKLNELAL